MMKTKERISALLTGMTGRLMLSLILMAVLPASVIGFLAYRNARQTIEERVHAELNTVADFKQGEISSWLELLISDAQLVADNFLTEEHITVILDPTANPELQAAFGNFLTENLLSLQQSRQGYKEIYFVDQGGRIILSTDRGRVGESVALEPIVGSVFANGANYFIEDLFLRDGRPEMAVGYVLHHVDIEAMQVEELVNAAVVIRVDVAANLFLFLQNWTGRGESGELLLTKRVDDLYVYLSPLRFAEDAPLSLALPDHLQSDGANHSDMSGAGQVDQTQDYRGVDIIRTYREIPEMGWGFIRWSQTFSATNEG